jgi:predicted transcriptional regulator
MPSTDPALFVSLKPRFAEMILSGEKTVEIRRVPPTILPGAQVILYASAPSMQVVGSGRVGALDSASPTALWERYRDGCGLSRSEFRSYLTGVRRAAAITLNDVNRLPQTIPLAELSRLLWTDFRPPQSWRYLDADMAAALLRDTPPGTEL